MLAQDIDAYETQTHERYLNEGKIIPEKEGEIDVFDMRLGYKSYFYNSTTTKKRIVLHYTTGFLGGDISTLCTPNYHVSVSFVVARNGLIYRLFPSANWSYHTGIGTIGGNEAISKSPIGIEISNIGYLDQSGNWMWNYYGDRYCKIGHTEYYTTLDQPFREKKHYATYTSLQYETVRRLLDHLCIKHEISRTFLPEGSRYEPFASSKAGKDYEGISTTLTIARAANGT